MGVHVIDPDTETVDDPRDHGPSAARDGPTERAPGSDRDRSLLEDPLAQGRTVDLDFGAREDVERSVRTKRGENIDLCEFLEDQVASRPELLHHGLEWGCGSAERRDARLLGKRGGASDGVLLNLG